PRVAALWRLPWDRVVEKIATPIDRSFLKAMQLIPALHSMPVPVTMLSLLDSILFNKTGSEVSTMKFPGGLNIQGMMKQAQQMQEKMAREMEELRVEASAGGGVVNVEMKGDHEIISLKIDPEIVKENDIEMLQDMIVAAINEGNRKVNEAMKSKLGSMLPPGLGNLF
ncbi:MAG: nucleoid-associated protein EbfC, partial [Blastocatellia bacterium]|nr:nucleoid-associated protein EbfC [Blastocatellia bacterium]